MAERKYEFKGTSMSTDELIDYLEREVTRVRKEAYDQGYAIGYDKGYDDGVGHCVGGR